MMEWFWDLMQAAALAGFLFGLFCVEGESDLPLRCLAGVVAAVFTTIALSPSILVVAGLLSLLGI